MPETHTNSQKSGPRSSNALHLISRSNVCTPWTDSLTGIALDTDFTDLLYLPHHDSLQNSFDMLYNF